MKAIGITCGVGSLLIGAKQAGFEVVGNLDWRRYYLTKDEHGRNTFTEYFRGAIFKGRYEDLEPVEIERMMNADLALSHPECGNFSQLSGVNKGREEKLLDPCDIPLCIDLVAKFRPRFLAMDDLPKSFNAFPISEYARRLPDYDLWPELICNWGYGNVQKHRNRMFMLASRKEERWTFAPGERENPRTLLDVIGDLPEPRVGSNYPNHYPCPMDELAQKSLSLRHIGDRPTWRDVAEYAKENWKPGQSMTYHANDGTIKYKPGCKIEHYDHHGASVQDGGSYKLHPIRLTPLTLRERARIQGAPDDFIFYGPKLNEAGEYNPDRNVIFAKQSGKFMPVEFGRYISNQVAAHIEGRPFESSGKRLLKPDVHVDDAKRWYCENVGYADQPAACGACWLYKGCTIRTNKYDIGASARSPEEVPSELGAGAPGPVTGRTSRKTATPRGSAKESPAGRPPADLAAREDSGGGGPIAPSSIPEERVVRPAATYQKSYGKGVSNL